MAAVAGPRTVRAGLVLNLDAANSAKAAGLTVVEVLVVAGGGGGGGDLAGGGGGGGVLTGTTTITPQAYTVTVGDGGRGGIAGSTRNTENTRGGDGQNSSALGLTAIGGGGGGVYGASSSTLKNGRNGGSGGGAGSSEGANAGTGGLGISSQGNNGGLGLPNPYAGGGGGGAGAAGQDAPNAQQGGNGGDGVTSLITGSSVTYAGGGGGSDYRTIAGAAPGSGGSGGGGNGGGSNGGTVTIVAQNGIVNTGGGGGGGAWQGTPTSGGAGGSGIVVIRYPGPQRATGGTVTQAGGDTVHTFTTVGSSTFVPFPSFANGVAFTGAADLSGLNNVGTALGAPVYASDNQGVFTLDGVDDRIDSGNDASINFGTGDFTVSLWFRRFANATTNLRLLSKAAGGDGSTAASAGFCFFGGNTNLVFAVNPTAPRSFVTAASFALNEWVCVTGLVQRGVSMRAYKNANLTDSTTAPVGSVSGTTSLFIGDNVGANLRWAGEISQVLLYNRALTQAEIAQNFEAQRGRFGI